MRKIYFPGDVRLNAQGQLRGLEGLYEGDRIVYLCEWMIMSNSENLDIFLQLYTQYDKYLAISMKKNNGSKNAHRVYANYVAENLGDALSIIDVEDLRCVSCNLLPLRKGKSVEQSIQKWELGKYFQ
jgi:hypothetical protein